MNLVKVGDRYINLDLVYQISFNDKQREKHPDTKLEAELDVAFPISMYSDGVEEGEDNPLEAAGMRVFGEEAEALRFYLDRRCTDAVDLRNKNLINKE